MITEQQTLNQHKQFQQEFVGEPILGEDQQRDRSVYLELGKLLNLALNNSLVQPLAFVSRHLWENITGSDKRGRLLARIVYAHQPTLSDEIKLKWKKREGYLFWHSAKQLAKDTNLNVHTIYKLIPEMANQGWFDLILKQDDFGRKIYHFKLNIKFFLKKLAALVYPHLVKNTKCILQFWQNVSYIENKYKKEKEEEEDKNFSTNSMRQESKTESDRNSKSKIENRKSEVNSEQKSNSQEETNVPRVDEKINKNKSTMNEDRYFPIRNQQSEIRTRAKAESVLGFSEFKSVEDMRECQKKLTLYFAQKESPEKAADKAYWLIDGECKGKRSLWVQDYLDGLPIGSWCQNEWEIEPGVIKPVFASYLRHKLRKGEDTREQVNVKLHWFLKDIQIVQDSWAECKRLIDIERPRLLQAIKLKQNLAATNIPQWIIESFREEIPIEQIVDTAEVLGAIATQYNEQTKQIQRQLQPSVEDIPELDDSSPIKALLNNFKILDPENTDPQQEERDKRVKVDEVMDKVAEDNEIFESMPRPLHLREELQGTAKINSLIADSITRAEGIKLAKKQGLPLLISNEGTVIGIDFESIKATGDVNFTPSPTRDSENFYQEGHNDAHKIYQPEQIEKGGKSAWDEMVSKSKFLSNLRRRK